jgi:hypothetical protein
MELTFVTDIGQTFVVDIDPSMELENVMALLEAEVRTRSLSFLPGSSLTLVTMTMINLGFCSVVYLRPSKAFHTMNAS